MPKPQNYYVKEIVPTLLPGVPDDLFLCCTSFEERCVAASQRLSEIYQARLSCIFRFMPSDTDEDGFDEARDRNAAKLANLLKGKTLEVEPATIICDKLNVEDGVSQLSRILDAHFPGGCQLVTIDMSSFTKVYFWKLMLFLVERYSAKRVRVLYTRSRSIPSDALTAGAHPPIRLPRFSGKFSPARRTLLLGFVGFEPQRAILVYEEFEPDRAELFVSYNPQRPEYFERALKVNEYLLTRPGVRWSRVEPYDPYSALGCLEKALSSSQSGGEAKNIILMSLGTKVQNLAGFLFWCRHPEVHLAYAFPTKYAKDHLRLQPGATFSFSFGLNDFIPQKRSSP
jgi:hypothetical protein